MGKVRTISPVIKVLLIMCTVLMGILGIEWFLINKSFSEETVLVENQNATTNAEFLIPKRLSLSKTDYIKRTQEALFTEGRKTIKEDVSPVEINNKKTTALPSIALVGISLSKEKSIALLKDNNGKYHRLVVGDTLDGWKIKSIKQKTIRVGAAGKSKTLALGMHKSAPKSKLPNDLLEPSPGELRIKRLPLHRGVKK